MQAMYFKFFPEELSYKFSIKLTWEVQIFHSFHKKKVELIFSLKSPWEMLWLFCIQILPLILAV